MEFRPVDRQSTVQKVAEQLREAVVASVVRSSQLPSEATLSDAMMVSRPTLREAIRILEAEGLVQRDHRTASLRPDVEPSSLSRSLRSALDMLTRTERITLAEIVDLRLTVTARAAQRAAEVATEEDVDRLAGALEHLREPGLSEQEWDERGLAFQVAMINASHNQAFLLIAIAAREAAEDIIGRAVVTATRAESRPLGSTALPADTEWTDQQYRLYHELFQAIRERRSDDALQHFLNWAKSCSEFFEPLPPDGDRTAGGGVPLDPVGP